MRDPVSPIRRDGASARISPKSRMPCAAFHLKRKGARADGAQKLSPGALRSGRSPLLLLPSPHQQVNNNRPNPAHCSAETETDAALFFPGTRIVPRSRSQAGICCRAAAAFLPLFLPSSSTEREASRVRLSVKRHLTSPVSLSAASSRCQLPLFPRFASCGR